MPTDGLRAALEGARDQIRADESFYDDEGFIVWDLALPVFERAVRSWLREMAGEELRTTLETIHERAWPHAPAYMRKNDVCIYERRLSPLFAALRERIEELEREPTEREGQRERS